MALQQKNYYVKDNYSMHILMQILNVKHASAHNLLLGFRPLTIKICWKKLDTMQATYLVVLPVLRFVVFRSFSQLCFTFTTQSTFFLPTPQMTSLSDQILFIYLNNAHQNLKWCLLYLPMKMFTPVTMTTIGMPVSRM